MSKTTTTTIISEITSTPSNYLKYNFNLPEKRYVGLLACQRDPLLTFLETKVIRCDKIIPSIPISIESTSKSKKSKVVVAATEVIPDEYELELYDTVIFPEGGGQPSDKGFITITEGEEIGKVIKVRQALRVALDAVHYVDQPIKIGTTVKVELDVENRIDLMCQHTGQHLLSGVIDRELQVDTVAWSLTPFPTPSYVELIRPLTLIEIESVQKQCNQFIATSTSVSVEMNLSSSMPSSVPSNYTSAHEDDKRSGVLRTVEIENLNDKNPCCGSHFPNLSYLQALYILPNQTTIRGTNARLYFLVGGRVLNHLNSSHIAIKTSAEELACSPAELSTRVKSLNITARDGMRREKKLKDELAGYIGKEIWEDAIKNNLEGNNIKRSVLLREEDSTNSLDFITAVSLIIRSKCEENKAIFALASGGSTNLSGGSLLIFGSDDLVLKASKEMASLFGSRVKGGGKGKWQGKLVGDSKWHKDDKALLEKVLENACL